jgi:hypothetical protein
MPDTPPYSIEAAQHPLQLSRVKQWSGGEYDITPPVYILATWAFYMFQIYMRGTWVYTF